MVKELKFSELEEKVLNEAKPVILKFWSEGCGPCQALAPVVEEISDETNEIEFYSVSIDNEKELAEHFSVMAAPTLLFIKDGGVVKKTIGFKSKESISEIIENYF